MIPAYQITFDDKDITSKVSDRLISLTIRDQLGLKDDSLDLVIDDRYPHVTFPKLGSEIRVKIGYKETGLIDKGLFLVDEIVSSGKPDTLTITASAANFSGQQSKNNLNHTLKSQRSRSWHGKTIGDIVKAIAKDNGYQSQISSYYAGITINHIDQTEESDINFLTRLADRYGATAKAANGLILFVEKGKGNSASGKQLPSIQLTIEDFISWYAPIAQRAVYKAVKAYWHNQQTAKRQAVVAGTGKPQKVISRTYPTEAEATEAAKAALRQSGRNSSKLNGVIIGRAEMAAEASIKVSGIRPEVDSTYTLIEVQHTISSAGYQVSFNADIK